MKNRKIVPLGMGYSAEADCVSEQEWSRLIERFRDCTIKQAWAFGAALSHERNMSRLVLRRDGEVVAVAQVKTQNFPIVGGGRGYISWAPLWMPMDREPDTEDFRQAIRALRNEYVCKRGFTLRMEPLVYDEDPLHIRKILAEEQFFPAVETYGGRTLVQDIAPDLNALRAGMEYKSRRNLRRGEEGEIEIYEGAGDEMLDAFVELYRDTVARKGFPPSFNPDSVKSAQRRLPERQKLRVFLCLDGGEYCAGAVLSTMGDTGLELWAATNDIGRRNSSSYLLRWKMVAEMKRMGQSAFNMNGIDPEANFGTYHFKRGFAGKHGRDLTYLGVFDAAPGIFLYNLLLFAYMLRRWYRDLRRLAFRLRTWLIRRRSADHGDKAIVHGGSEDDHG